MTRQSVRELRTVGVADARGQDESRDSDTDCLALELAALMDGVEGLDVVPPYFLRTCSTYTPDYWSAQATMPSRDDTAPTWHHLMPAPDSGWDAERRGQQADLKLLPRCIRRAVARIRSTYLRGAVLELAMNELRWRAAKQGRLFETRASSELLATLRTPLDYVPCIDTARLAREMRQDDAFMLRLFKTAKALTRQAWTLNTWSASVYTGSLPRIRIPQARPLQVEAWCGLTVAPLLHRPPEGLLVGLAQRCWANVKHRRSRPVHVMDWGAGNSPFTVALLAVKAAAGSDETGSVRRRRNCTREWLYVDEVETMGEAPPDLSFVRRMHAVPRGRVHDYVVIQLPPPCATRGGYRDRHKDLPAEQDEQRRLRDLGRLGVRRWSLSAPRVVRQVLSATVVSEEVSLIVPLFTVGVLSRDDSARAASCSVVAKLREVVRAAGLTITHDIAVDSAGSDERWICIVASRRKSRDIQPDFEDCDDIEAILEALS